jgi:hypothetical protein
VLRAAIKAVPAVRFALGIAGIVAAVAIIKALRLDFRIAVFGVIIMLVLMTVLLIFAKLSATAGSMLKIPMLLFAWFSLLITISTATLLFTSVFWRWPVDLRAWLAKPESNLSSTEQKVSNLEDEVNGSIRAAWENMDQSPADRQRVIDEAPKAAESLLLLSDSTLNPAWRIVKYEYAQQAFGMGSSAQPNGTEQDRLLKAKYADKCLKAGGMAVDIINEAKTQYGRDEKYTRAIDFVSKNSEEDRLRYFMAICLCRLADAKKDPKPQIEAQEMVNHITPSFVEKWPINNNPEFAHCISSK